MQPCRPIEHRWLELPLRSMVLESMSCPAVAMLRFGHHSAPRRGFPAQVSTMKSRVCLVVAASLWSCAALAARGPDTLDLMQVYKLALQNDPQIREADAIRLAHREGKTQAPGALPPQGN